MFFTILYHKIEECQPLFRIFVVSFFSLCYNLDNVLITKGCTCVKRRTDSRLYITGRLVWRISNIHCTITSGLEPDAVNVSFFIHRRLMEKYTALIHKLHKTRRLSGKEWAFLISGRTPKLSEYLFSLARKEQEHYYGKDIFVRGLIEFSNYCKNDCLYCGIRRSNRKACRYRLDEDAILACCHEGYALGFRTFVLQSGEDASYTKDRLVNLVRKIRKNFPDCAITLSVGEWDKSSYQEFFDAGADRYLLRHETYNTNHYAKLHPKALSAKNRRQCLWDLKDIGYQVGTGFMVGAPYQTPELLAEDMLFLKELNPQMVGIGPFIPHHDTPFKNEPAGTMELTLFLLGCIRLMLPKVLLPATTALGTIHPRGRELGILSGANVVMPNLSPQGVRKSYLLYDNKICTGEESAQCRDMLEQKTASIGYRIVTSRGDSLNMPQNAANS